jgi:hypothetical protein
MLLSASMTWQLVMAYSSLSRSTCDGHRCAPCQGQPGTDHPSAHTIPALRAQQQASGAWHLQ